MNILNSQIKPKSQSSLKHKKRLNQDHVELLEANFESNKKLKPEHKLQLARDLGVLPRQVAIWYQNRRARWKNQSLEHEFNTLKLKLEGALTEKRHLEKEMRKLKEELKKAKEMLLVASASSSQVKQTPNYNSSCCDEGLSSSFQDEGLHYFEELYEYSLIGVESGSNTNSNLCWANEKGFWL